MCYKKDMPKIVTEEMSQFSIRMPLQLKKRLSELAAREHRALGPQINLLLERALDELEKSTPPQR